MDSNHTCNQLGVDNPSVDAILISTLAMYQTVFWCKVAKGLARRGHHVGFLTFDDRSHEYLCQQGIETYNIPLLARSNGVGQGAFDEWTQDYGMTNSNLWLSHERITFGIRKSSILREKLMSSARAVDLVMREFVSANRRVILIQELGGFLSVIASFFVARKLAVDAYFIEPSFFRGRMFVLKNSFCAPVISGEALEVTEEVRGYLDATVTSRSLVMPTKDRHQYRPASRKVLSWGNATRLTEKIVDKYLLGKQQEFGYIWRYVIQHIEMLWVSFRLAQIYNNIEDLDRFIYYPLHVPGDVALTLRAPEYFDQLAVIDYLCRTAPPNYSVVIKEHPAMIGSVDVQRLLRMLRRYDNLVILRPDTNNYQVMHSAELVVSVNSKSGAEAVLIGKPVVVLGDAFYRDAPMVTHAARLGDLPKIISEILGRDQRAESVDVRPYFQRVWENTVPGELYVADGDNVVTFVDSITAATKT